MIVVSLIGGAVAQGEPLQIRDAPSAPAPAAWLEVREQTACEAMQDDYCLGRYGFTIRRDGTFIAGPSGQGSKVEGKIEQRELRRLRELVGRFSATVRNREKDCRPSRFPGVKDQLDITFSNGSSVRAYDLGGSVGKACFVGAWNRVHKLKDYVHGLMTRYYPVPFPKT